jgi:hypothetical protein
MKLAVRASILITLLAPSAYAESAFGRQTSSDVRGQVDSNAASPTGDGVYGRFDGDLDLGVGAGASYLTGADRFAFSARLSAHYFSVAGVYVDYADALDGEADPRRALGFGVDVRPLFIPRWSTNRQIGRPFLDLTLDSISLGLGAFFAEPEDESFGDERGFEASLGLGLPLLARADGPWLELRGALEWPNSGDMRAKALALLSFHFFALTPFARAD